MKYTKHVFICTNERADLSKKSCGEAHGMELVQAFKKQIKDLGLNIDIRAQRAGCLDVCELGPALVVYPEGVFYGKVELSDVDEIVTEHLIHNKPVERLRLSFVK
jgi:(2Fe-2S) ferredoxin